MQPRSTRMANCIEQHRPKNDEAQHNFLGVALDVRQVHPILNDGDCKGARERAERAERCDEQGRDVR